MGRVMDTFRAKGLTTREQVLDYIVQENIEAKQNGPQGSLVSTSQGTKGEGAEGDAIPPSSEYPSIAAMVCDAPQEALVKRIENEGIVSANRIEFSTDMVRRVLFPRYSAEEASIRTAVPAKSIEVPQFDDRTFFQLKIKPEFVTMGYDLLEAQKVPLSFPSGAAQELRQGAYIEGFSRPAVDAGMKYAELKALTGEGDLLPLPDVIKESVKWVDTSSTLEDGGRPDVNEEALLSDMPSFIGEAVEWQAGEIDQFNIPSEYLQVFKRHPRRCAMQPDWALRPGGLGTETLRYLHDPSLRTKWIGEGGFLATNTYLLGAQESRNKDISSGSGPTLRDFYTQDSDRHSSGLYCFANDHMRTIDDPDVDVAPLQSGKAREDCLTDSESDDEEAYALEKPSLVRARQILWDKQPDDEAAGDAGDNDSPDGLNINTEAFGLAAENEVDDGDKDAVQVELLRDRKIIEMEDQLKKDRYARMDSLTAKLVQISNACKVQPLALSVQLPFHQYEQELIDSGVLEGHPELEMPQKSFVEGSANGSASPLNLSMSMTSPVRS